MKTKRQYGGSLKRMVRAIRRWWWARELRKCSITLVMLPAEKMGLAAEPIANARMEIFFARREIERQAAADGSNSVLPKQ